MPVTPPMSQPDYHQNNCTSSPPTDMATSLHPGGHQHPHYPQQDLHHPSHHMTFSTSPSPVAASTTCSSSSVAELQRLSDSMAMPDQHRVQQHQDHGSVQSQQHQHYNQRRQQPYVGHRSHLGGHVDSRTSPIGQEDRLHHSHPHHGGVQEASSPTGSVDPDKTSAILKSNSVEEKSFNKIETSGDYFKASGRMANEFDDDYCSPPQYLSDNCVVYCYFKKDVSISQIVDDHFSRALNESANESSASPDSEKSKGKTTSRFFHLMSLTCFIFKVVYR